jgi:hypothetical protein
MPEQASASGPLMKSAVVGTILQLLLAVLAKYVPSLAGMAPAAGVGIGGVAGLLYSLWNKGAAMPNAAGGGAVAGGVGGLLGTVLSNVLGGGALTSAIATGTGYPAVAGVVGGLIGKLLGGRSA